MSRHFTNRHGLSDEAVCKRVLDIVDRGLTRGLGKSVPGEMCVEAAVCYALGEEHGDKPTCVHQNVRDAKIMLNDTDGWFSNSARALGLRRLAIAQLGTRHLEDFGERFTDECLRLALTKYMPRALRAIAALDPYPQHWERCLDMLKERAGRGSNQRDTLRELYHLVRYAPSFTPIDMHVTAAPMPDLLSVECVERPAHVLKRIHWLENAIYRTGAMAPIDDSGAMRALMLCRVAILIENWDKFILGSIDGDPLQMKPDMGVTGQFMTLCEEVVQILKGMGSPGAAFLYLTEK
jgi:hypothetical protein